MNNDCLHKALDVFNKHFPDLNWAGISRTSLDRYITDFFQYESDNQICLLTFHRYLVNIGLGLKMRCVILTYDRCNRLQNGKARIVVTKDQINDYLGEADGEILPAYLVLVNTKTERGFEAGHYYLLSDFTLLQNNCLQLINILNMYTNLHSVSLK